MGSFLGLGSQGERCLDYRPVERPDPACPLGRNDSPEGIGDVGGYGQHHYGVVMVWRKRVGSRTSLVRFHGRGSAQLGALCRFAIGDHVARRNRDVHLDRERLGQGICVT